MALVQKQFGDLITFTRASAGGRFNAAGVFEMVPANQPRFDFDPVTKNPKGILIEGARTNLFLNSSKLGLMSKNSGATINEENAVAPNGLLEAGRLTLTPNVSSGLYRFGISSNSQSTWSVFVKPISGSGRIRLIMEGPAYNSSSWAFFDLYAGTYTTSAADVVCGMQAASGGWWRVNMTRPINNPGSTHTIAIYSGEALEEKVFDVWMGQFEQGAFATTPIPTSATQVTRAADVARVNVLSPWFNPAEGTLYVEVEPASLDINNWYAALTDGTLNNAIDIGTAAGGRSRSRVLVGGATEASVSSIDQLTKISKIVTAYRKGLMVNATNGKVRSAALANLPASITTLGIGMIATFQYSPGLIRSIRYYPRSLTDSELQALTT